jgi:hypothetical protein
MTVSWLWGVLVAAGVLVGGAFSGIVGDELRGWLRRLPFGLLWIASRTTPPSQRAELLSHWRADIEAELRERHDRPITQLLFSVRFATGLVTHGYRVAKELRATRLAAATTATPEGRTIAVVAALIVYGVYDAHGRTRSRRPGSPFRRRRRFPGPGSSAGPTSRVEDQPPSLRRVDALRKAIGGGNT